MLDGFVRPQLWKQNRGAATSEAMVVSASLDGSYLIPLIPMLIKYALSTDLRTSCLASKYFPI